MKATVRDCKDTFKIGYEAFMDSRAEADEVWDMFHNRHYTYEQLAILENRGQPKETFNVIKLFARMLVGYYSTVINTAVVRPKHPRHITTATVLNDTINHVFHQNRMDIEGDQTKLGGIVSGLLCAYEEVLYTGLRDEFNRPINEIKLHHVPDSELVLDPMSQLDDYSDAKYLHRYKWMSEDDVVRTFGKEAKDKMSAYQNFTDAQQADFDYRFTNISYRNDLGYVTAGFAGYYRVHDNYLIVHTVMEDEDGKRWSIFWHDDIELDKQEITTKAARWPYRVQKLQSSNKAEYYGVFREVVESQKAINQALLQIQLMANTTKVYVEHGAVDNIEEFQSLVNRVNAVIPVNKIAGIKVDQMSKEVLDQYTIIDKAFDRVQRILGINDSFLGMAYASDSGRKVKLQQGATIMSLRYMTARIEAFYTSLAMDVAKLAQQYYRAHQFLLMTDAMTGQRWVEINKPMMRPTGEVDEEGNPIEEPILLELLDPANGEPMEDEEGNLILAPVSEEGTDFAFDEYEIIIESSAYNDEDEKGQLMLESVMSGQIGSMLAQVNPAGFFKISSLAMKTMGTKYSPQISQILDETAEMLAGSQEAQQGASEMAQGSPRASGGMSQALKLPQNTNEGMYD
jgi:hypothetical protein